MSQPAGIRATVEFARSDVCPIADLSNASEGPIASRSTSVSPGETDRSVTEFLAPVDPDEAIDLDGEATIESVVSYGSATLYRLVHDRAVSCPCECLGTFGCPVERYFARDGSLTVVFHADDYDQLRDVVAELRERFPDVDVKRLVRSPTAKTEDAVFVDRSKLTERQFEVLQTAYEMGYFEQPRRANATAVASELGIGQSTFAEHLAAAQAKLFEDVLEDGT